MTIAELILIVTLVVMALFVLCQIAAAIVEHRRPRLNEYGRIVEANEHDAHCDGRKFKNE